MKFVTIVGCDFTTTEIFQGSSVICFDGCADVNLTDCSFHSGPAAAWFRNGGAVIYDSTPVFEYTGPPNIFPPEDDDIIIKI